MTATKSGAAGGKKRKWYLYDRMLFILPYTSDRSTTTNVVPLPSDDVVDAEDNMSQASTSSFTSVQHVGTPTPIPSPTLTVDETNHQDPPSNHPGTSESQSQPQHNPRARRPKLFPRKRAKHSEFESEMLKAAQRLGAKKEETDEDEYFFKNLVPKMKLLNTVDKMKCEVEIHMVVLKYVEKVSKNAVAQPERINLSNTYNPCDPPQCSSSPQAANMQHPNQYEEYHYATSQYKQY